MSDDVRYGAAPADVKGYDTAALRSAFLVSGLFRSDRLKLVYTHVDRMIVGGCAPAAEPIEAGDGALVGTEYLLSDREMGVVNVGGAGRVSVDDQTFDMADRDVLYVGRGGRRIVLESADPADPARFYLNSVPAKDRFPHRLIARAESKPLDLGEGSRANKRQLRMYIHPEVAPSSLLLMGVTDIAPGSVWNTMPPHLHERRMEAYLYFDLAAGDRVFHVMGRPDETRHIVVANGEAVISPAWSIHMGAGTGPYAFVWGMTGENQQYNDVDPVDVSSLL
ncbi:MAG: 5-dehydro-4-deoxy-D-glucuronate isomerase [Rhizobiales bacterium]|nr:5-dehydro-4-deoxy-D-glucuronate isomerase [Hyphomicrobiales bacterium]